MDKDSTFFPSIPASTVRAARTLYGRGNAYLRLGDRLNFLISKLDSRSIASQLGDENTLLLALLTIVQYVEKMTDLELAASIQQRMDLRYALHLATPSPRLDPHALCAFRSRLLVDAQGRFLFGKLFQSIYPELTSNLLKQEPGIDDVLSSICENEVRISLIEAMLRCMEALSANHFHWLRRVALPHWYQRYNRAIAVTHSNYSLAKQELTRDDILGDIQYLLYEIRESNSSDIMEMRETKQLIRIWQQMTESESVKSCQHCIVSVH